MENKFEFCFCKNSNKSRILFHTTKDKENI